jgi:sialate O-acetylesterase
MKPRILLWIFASWVAGAANAFADVTLAPLFRDGAILQRDQPIVIWGTAAAAEKVYVKFRNQNDSVITAADGRWKLTLKPEKATLVGSELVATGANTVVVRDVLVGDVWLCSGQSNMVFSVKASADGEREMATADFPLIRHFKLPSVVAEKPADEVAGTWVPCSPSTVAGFSAVAYFFARDLHKKLGVPIGIVNSSWGGTQIEAWISEPALRADPAASEIFSRWEKRLADHPQKLTAHAEAVAKIEAQKAADKTAGKKAKRVVPAKPEGPGSRWLPGGLYNAMIAPLVPYTFRGVLWYQGEANAARHSEYASLFTGMIKQWRAAFEQPLPFYFVQLANFENAAGNKGDTWAYQREAQARALALPDTAMAVTIDVGEPKDIHPRNKQDVGQRLAFHARKHLFGEKIESDGPMFVSAKREGAEMRVAFTHADELKLHPAKTDGRISFEIAGADRKFVPATARVEGDTLVVTAPNIAEPVAVRYAWKNSPDARLFNGAGLPAAPFRSDDW